MIFTCGNIEISLSFDNNKYVIKQTNKGEIELKREFDSLSHAIYKYQQFVGITISRCLQI